MGDASDDDMMYFYELVFGGPSFFWVAMALVDPKICLLDQYVSKAFGTDAHTKQHPHMQISSALWLERVHLLVFGT